MHSRRQVVAMAAALAVNRFGLSIGSPLPGAKAQRILLVHGRGQEGRDPAAVKTEWTDALKAGAALGNVAMPSNISIDFPFYGDLLDRYSRENGIPLTSEINARGGPQVDEFLVFQAEVAEAIRTQAGITDEQVATEFGDDPSPRGPLNWKWVQAILRAIDKHGGGLNNKPLEVFTRDVFLYTTRSGIRDEVDGIVSRALTEEPTVVIAHSLGTVVAYSILRNDRRRLKIPLFITLGSPLGVRAIRNQLIPIRMPAPVENWYNAYDARDVVSLYPLDARNFPISPAIENFGSVRNSTPNRHGIVGYLGDGTVAKKIVQHLTQ
jgi:hypothetical protein